MRVYKANVTHQNIQCHTAVSKSRSTRPISANTHIFYYIALKYYHCTKTKVRQDCHRTVIYEKAACNVAVEWSRLCCDQCHCWVLILTIVVCKRFTQWESRSGTSQERLLPSQEHSINTFYIYNNMYVQHIGVQHVSL